MRISQNSLLALATAAAALGLAGCHRKVEADPRTEPQLVRAAEVGLSSDAARVFTGVVTARVESNLGFRVPGKITKRLVDTGQVVHAGQLLMTIDPTDYAHAVTARMETVEAAKARAVQAIADEARYRGLVKTGAISASTYDQIKAAADAAEAELRAAEAQQKVAMDEGDYSKLIADSDGVVVETTAEPGQVVSAGQTVVKLAHAGPREAAVNLPETIRPKLGSTAFAAVYGQTDRVPARLRQLSDAADPLTRTYEARYVLGGKDANAPIGATVTIHLESESQALSTIPVASIIDLGKGTGVWVVNSSTNTVSFHPVQIRSMTEEEAIVSQGLRPEDKIVALGAHLLHEGDKVRVEEQQAEVSR
ncbi:efflux RND transporter periplasmic adaptor subunit [Granulicella sibirica]|uniref:Putative Co/Zn/Cd efflux system membrane fusion protein n=1 Tax=Granulicella sibirica TaxID=2479048 RepID=A0A4Q0T6A9_9BACT|nr:efflux RND transporter periplasmic adaptor subunit [Granulicella sibirica]RXH57166.1 putative Co/Zn/Cd efflux system membrane fusion protein [Granulicella sibirica]